MPACAVAVCRNYTKTTKGTDVKYFSFPRDPAVQEEWVFRCGRDTEFNVANSRICSEHFTKEQFERDLMNELLGLPTKRTLKASALPTVNIGDSFSRPLATHVAGTTQEPPPPQLGEEDGYYDDDDEDEDQSTRCVISEGDEENKNLVGYHCTECAAAGAEYSLSKTGRLRKVKRGIKREAGEVSGVRRGGRKRIKSWSRAAAFSNSQTLSERLRAENHKLKKQLKELQTRLQRDQEEEESTDWEAAYKALKLKYEDLESELNRYKSCEAEEMVVMKTGDLHGEYAMKPKTELRVPSPLEGAEVEAEDEAVSFEQPIYVWHPSATDIDMDTVLLQHVAN